jgi:hypothetical protein
VRRRSGSRDRIRRTTNRGCSAKPSRGQYDRVAPEDVLTGRSRVLQAVVHPARPESGLRGHLRRAVGHALLRRVASHVRLRRSRQASIRDETGRVRARTGLANPLAALAEKIRAGTEALGLVHGPRIRVANGSRFGRPPISAVRASRKRNVTSSRVKADRRVSGPRRAIARASRERQVFLDPNSARPDPRPDLRRSPFLGPHLDPGRSGTRQEVA